jgi:hypothetical protein
MQWLSLVKTFGAVCDAGQTFFGLPVWYKYLRPVDDGAGGCRLDALSDAQGHFKTEAVFLIGLGVVDILLRLVAMVAFGAIIYGGFLYMTSQGEPDRTKKAKDTILGAIIGLVLAFIAIPLVQFVGSRIGAGL